MKQTTKVIQKQTIEICSRVVMVIALFQYSNLRIAFIIHIMFNHSLGVLLGAEGKFN